MTTLVFHPASKRAKALEIILANPTLPKPQLIEKLIAEVPFTDQWKVASAKAAYKLIVDNKLAPASPVGVIVRKSRDVSKTSKLAIAHKVIQDNPDLGEYDVITKIQEMAETENRWFASQLYLKIKGGKLPRESKPKKEKVAIQARRDVEQVQTLKAPKAPKVKAKPAESVIAAIKAKNAVKLKEFYENKNGRATDADQQIVEIEKQLIEDNDHPSFLIKDDLHDLGIDAE